MAQIVYRNQNATRNQPLTDQLVTVLVAAADAVGIDSVVIISGGQPSIAEDPTGQHRTGGPRHDHGNAADLDLTIGGRVLNFTEEQHDLPIVMSFVWQARQAGATGIGAAPDYMGPTRLHVGFGSVAIWGADRTHASAPYWLRAAFSGMSFDDVKRLQTLLRDRGYHEVGNIDGNLGSRTLGALNRFRVDNHLPTHGAGDYDVTPEDWAALARAGDATVSEQRSTVTARDLAAEGSRTVNSANAAIAATGASTTIGIAGTIAQAVQPVTDAVNTVTPHISTIQRLIGMVGDLWPLVVLPIAAFAIWQMVKIIRARVDDQRTGRHA